MPNLSTDTVSKAAQDATHRLRQVGIETPVLDARILLAHVLNADRTALISRANDFLTHAECTAYEAFIARRLKHEPVSRILGEREFWGLPFGLNEATLDPRADSETLVEAVLRLMPQEPKNILDLGTGSGCLLLSLLSEFKKAHGLGVDIAPRALEQAKANALRLKLDDRTTFKKSDWLTDVTGKFDLIVSNPPYISAEVIPTLKPDVRDFDPMLALDGGEDGLSPYRVLIPTLPDYLNENALVVVEVGFDQARLVAKFFKRSLFHKVTKHKDLGGVERCVSAIWRTAKN